MLSTVLPAIRPVSWKSPVMGRNSVFSRPALADQESTALALRKLGDRVHLLNLLLTQLRKKLRHRPLELGTVQHELPREVGQMHLEVSELQQQVAELRKHLTMAGPRREPPHRRQLQREGLADWRPVGMEDQTESPSFPLEGAQPLQTLSVPHLQRKLKDAARKILSLHLEREQLLEMGNRLRAELGHPKGNLPPGPPPPTSEPQDALEVPEKPSRRPPLGQLQPHSTAQDPRHTERKCVSEYAQKNQPHSAEAVSKNNSPRGRKAGTASRPAQKPHRAPAETWKSADQKENRPPRAPQAQTVLKESGCRTHASSSLASSSLQDAWRPLDLGSSLPGVPSQGGSASECPEPPGASCSQKADQSPVSMQRAFAVQGLKMEPQPKATHFRPSKSHPVKPTNCQQQRLPRIRIRNYNLKD